MADVEGGTAVPLKTGTSVGVGVGVGVTVGCRVAVGVGVFVGGGEVGVETAVDVSVAAATATSVRAKVGSGVGAGGSAQAMSKQSMRQTRGKAFMTGLLSSELYSGTCNILICQQTIAIRLAHPVAVAPAASQSRRAALLTVPAWWHGCAYMRRRRPQLENFENYAV